MKRLNGLWGLRDQSWPIFSTLQKIMFVPKWKHLRKCHSIQKEMTVWIKCLNEYLKHTYSIWLTYNIRENVVIIIQGSFTSNFVTESQNDLLLVINPNFGMRSATSWINYLLRMYSPSLRNLLQCHQRSFSFRRALTNKLHHHPCCLNI